MFNFCHFKSKGLFFINAAVLMIVASGYFLWNNPSSAASTITQQDENTLKEKQYYKDLVYTVNEINDQIQDFEDQLSNHQDISLDSVKKGKDKVNQLIQPLTHPPDSFQVSFMIADDMYKYYSQYVDEIGYSNPAFITSSKRTQLTDLIHQEYQRFRENYQLIQVFDQFKSIDIDCH
jgi:cell division protein FtsB